MDPKQLYQEIILDHNKKPRNYGKLGGANHRAEGLNPLCGDHIWVALDVKDERVAGIAFEGQSCAICKASASMMTTSVKGKTVAEAEQMIQEFRDMATGKAVRVCRGEGPSFARQVRHLAVAHLACSVPKRGQYIDGG